jgi:hypothetical protein
MAVVAVSLTGCNEIAKNYGGSLTVNLDKDQKLVNCSWRGSSLWILTRPRREGETPETYMYFEKSNMSIFEGSVTIVEK